MTPISDDHIDESLAWLNDLEPEDAPNVMESMADRQPELLAYVMTMSEDLSEDAGQSLLFMMLVIYTSYEKAYGTIPQIDEDILINCDERMTERLTKLEGKSGQQLMQAGLDEVEHQPALMQYVITALVEPAESPDDPVISPDESGFMFIVLKAAIDAIEETMRSSVWPKN